MKILLHSILLLLLSLIFVGCTVPATNNDDKSELNQGHKFVDGNTDRFIQSRDDGRLIVKQSKIIPHDQDITGVYRIEGVFNNKSYYKHESKGYYIFWDTGSDYGATESEKHTGGYNQWDLSDGLGGDEIIYSASENILGDWSSDAQWRAEKNRTGIVTKGPEDAVILESSGQIDAPHDPEIDGIYKKGGSFNGKSYYKHESKGYYIFWDTGSDYGATESEKHTGGHNQWDLSDRLGGDEIIYSTSENILGDWLFDISVGVRDE